MDWKAFVSPQFVFKYPLRALGTLCAAFGVLHAPFDFNNRYLAFGVFLLCLSSATDKSRRVYRSSPVIIGDEETPYIFSPSALLQSLFLWALTVALALLCLHQLGVTPRLDALFHTWAHSHYPL
jgi:hypothetical protein